MSLYIGIDTSNYTTSAAVYDGESGRYVSKTSILKVEEGKKGLSQSEALFLHTKNLPDLIRDLFSEIQTEKIAGVGVSNVPRRIAGSYMPCFLAGVSAASAIASTAGVKLKTFSHQEGHIGAALLSSNRLDVFKSPFYAVHVSGGTTEILKVSPGGSVLDAALLASKSDISAGQLIDRVGVMLGLPFPAGKYLDELALRGEPVRVKPSVINGQANFSGFENVAKKMFEVGKSKEDIARFCMDAVGDTLFAMLAFAVPDSGGCPVVFMGGVMASRLLRERFGHDTHAVFASSALSSDNAAGIAVLSYLF